MNDLQQKWVQTSELHSRSIMINPNMTAKDTLRNEIQVSLSSRFEYKHDPRLFYEIRVVTHHTPLRVVLDVSGITQRD